MHEHSPEESERIDRLFRLLEKAANAAERVEKDLRLIPLCFGHLPTKNDAQEGDERWQSSTRTRK